MHKIEQLKRLYSQNSKHSNYQILSKRLSELIGKNEISVHSRYEIERLNYFKEHINFKETKVCDIGGNTGYFSFELLELGCQYVYYFEGQTNHANFVNLASEVLEVKNRISIHNDYYLFNGKDSNIYDVVLCLNVLHHVGDDYGDQSLTIDKAKAKMIRQLNSLAKNSQRIIFQMGFCWKGNRNLLLFENGTKKEMIDFIQSGTSEFWEIEHIGVASESKNNIQYLPLDELNIERNDRIGEFLNRPIFIMKSKILDIDML